MLTPGRSPIARIQLQKRQVNCAAMTPCMAYRNASGAPFGPGFGISVSEISLRAQVQITEYFEILVIVKVVRFLGKHRKFVLFSGGIPNLQRAAQIFLFKDDFTSVFFAEEVR